MVIGYLGAGQLPSLCSYNSPTDFRLSSFYNDRKISLCVKLFLPVCLQVEPASGPLEGGILVTITGSNLGMKYEDVVGGVTVAGIQCLPQSKGYKISTR